MFKTKRLKAFGISSILFLASFVFTPFASALELEVSENGSGSSNEVIVRDVSQVSVNQENSANITNSVYESANTGENSTSGNSGVELSIETGDVASQTSIINQSNYSFAETPCCPASADLTIAGNGSSTSNQISLQEVSQTTVSTSQNASINNSISGYANTGENSANGNTEDNVSISTGDVDIGVFLKNFINIGGVDIDCCPFDPGEKEPPSEDGEDEDREEEQEEDDEKEGEILPAAAATEAGGPGIVGLSDTSSRQAQALFYWIGLAMIALGGKIVVNELLNE